MTDARQPIARGPGGRHVRRVLVVIAVLYFAALIKSPPQIKGLYAVTFFSQATCLFPEAASYAIEYRLETWSCAERRWNPIDPRPFFPIEADSKESRFQRIAYFYQQSRPVLNALDAWLVDQLPGAGGIRLVKYLRPLPAPGTPAPHYTYTPLDPVPDEHRRDLYWTRGNDRAARCRAR
ncbi:MAG: hypothetical protein KF773_16970 [Deltaproteobacteria bacterium]|nr:hypothetical protein [Deltaproteobacteria bacterium]